MTKKYDLESNALVKRTDKGLISNKGRRSQISLTSDIIRAAAVARTSSRALVDESWMQEIWEWADKFELSEEQVPRNKEELIALKKLDIKMCHPKDLEQLLIKKTELEEEEEEERTSMAKARNMGIFGGPGVRYRQRLGEIQSLSTQISHLKELEATTNKMNYIPIELVHLKNLVEITFSGIESSNLLKKIGPFRNLTKLNIRNCNTNGLFESICQISYLIELSIWDSITGILPDSICQLSNLITLDISNNEITELPDSICQLSNLTTLNISNNKISQLPDSICQLSNLTTLNISNNGITELSDSICQLSNLTTLNISNNKISQLPENIGQLTSLQTFFAHSNQRLCNIPVSMAKLSNLTTFNVDSTRITEIPKFMKDNSRLSVDYINNFPF